MIVGQQKYINLIKVWNITNQEIIDRSGVSNQTIKRFKAGESIQINQYEKIVQAIEEIIKYRKSLK